MEIYVYLKHAGDTVQDDANVGAAVDKGICDGFRFRRYGPYRTKQTPNTRERKQDCTFSKRQCPGTFTTTTGSENSMKKSQFPVHLQQQLL
jgi:hypothetical protein